MPSSWNFQNSSRPRLKGGMKNQLLESRSFSQRWLQMRTRYFMIFAGLWKNAGSPFQESGLQYSVTKSSMTTMTEDDLGYSLPPPIRLVWHRPPLSLRTQRHSKDQNGLEGKPIYHRYSQIIFENRSFSKIDHKKSVCVCVYIYIYTVYTQYIQI